MKIIVTVIPTDLVTSLLKAGIWFSPSWWSGNEKYFCFLFTVSPALLQSYAEFKRLL